MSAIDQLREESRQERLDDGWYQLEKPYALQLVSPEEDAVFVFPLGPQAVTTSRVMRQAVTPTMGGLIAEEQGLLWKTITVKANFGLSPRAGSDTSKFGPYAPHNPTDKLSGPMWTMRLLRNFIERYGELKADPTKGAATYLVWHDFRTEEHYVVVPEVVDLERSIATRLMYPFTLKFKSIGDADAIDEPGESASNFLSKVKDVIAAIAKGLAIVQGALQEVSGFLGEVRYFAATIDSLIDDVTRIVSAAQDVINGGARTAAFGASFIASITALLDEVLETLEAAADVPYDVTAQYRNMVDGLDAMAAQLAAFGRSYDEDAAVDSAASAGLSKTSTTDAQTAADGGSPSSSADMANANVPVSTKTLQNAGALPATRAYSNYPGVVSYVIQRTDTLPSIAAKFLRDGAKWYDIALMNGLKSPYISKTGAPGTVAPGDTIAVPSLKAVKASAVSSAAAGTTQAELLGRDFRLYETNGSRPGRASVDITLDRRTMRDAALIEGVPNLVQATQMRTWTLRGSMPTSPTYGLPRMVGFGNRDSNVTALKTALRGTLRQDSRVDRVLRMQATIDSDTVEFDVDVLPVGSTSATSVSTALT